MMSTMNSPHKPHRLTARQQFVSVADSGVRWVTPGFILQALPRPAAAAGPPRYGLTASRKTGSAVYRNRARRRLRTLAQQHLLPAGRADTDYVLIARAPEIFKRPFDLLQKDLAWAMKHIQRQLETPDA